MNYDQIRAKIDVPPEMQDAYLRGTIAGMKMLFSDQTHDMLLEHLQKAKGKSLGQVVGGAAAGALGYVMSVSKGQIPPMLTIPLGVEIALQIFEFLETSKRAAPTPDDVGEAISTMITTVMGKMQEGQEMNQQPAAAPQQAPQQGLLSQGAPQ